MLSVNLSLTEVNIKSSRDYENENHLVDGKNKSAYWSLAFAQHDHKQINIQPCGKHLWSDTNKMVLINLNLLHRNTIFFFNLNL